MYRIMLIEVHQVAKRIISWVHESAGTAAIYRPHALEQLERDVLTASAVVDLLDARAHAAQSLRAAGAPVVEASPKALAGACAQAYLRAKSRQRV